MPIDYEELQKYFDENHLAVNDPLNPGMSEEEAPESGVMIDVTEEDVGFVITPTIPDGTDGENKSGETDKG